MINQNELYTIGKLIKQLYDEKLVSLYMIFDDFFNKHNIYLTDLIKDEIKIVIYFIYDFIISSGHESDIRNNLRTSFITALNLTDSVKIEYDNKLKSYINALKDDDNKDNWISGISKVFAKNINNEDPMVWGWAIIAFGNSIPAINNFVTGIVDELNK